MRIVLVKKQNFQDFSPFREAARRYTHFVVAYSGGKDSTATAIYLYHWLKEDQPNIEVSLLYNDTLSEVNPLESWVRSFMSQFREKASKYVEVKTRIARPEALKTFFWRVYVRGYPAPTFVFRWCVDHLKLEPLLKEVKNLKGAVVVTGQRDEESGARAASMKKMYGSCLPGSCAGAFFAIDGEVPKLAPIRFWTTRDVWHFLLYEQSYFDIEPLVSLYMLDRNTLTSAGGRFGCWHCTLVKTHSALFFGGKSYGYVEALRLIYKAVSDIKDLRVPKTGGYSKLGPLTPLARSIVYNLVPIVEEKSGHRFYGLDETYIGGATLREIFYIMPEEKADRVVRSVDDTNRWIGMRHLRNIEKILYQQVEDKIIEKIKEYDHLNTVTRFAEELLNQLR